MAQRRLPFPGARVAAVGVPQTKQGAQLGHDERPVRAVRRQQLLDGGQPVDHPEQRGGLQQAVGVAAQQLPGLPDCGDGPCPELVRRAVVGRVSSLARHRVPLPRPGFSAADLVAFPVVRPVPVRSRVRLQRGAPRSRRLARRLAALSGRPSTPSTRAFLLLAMLPQLPLGDAPCTRRRSRPDAPFEDGPQDREAAALVLLYAQPLTRIARLGTSVHRVVGLYGTHPAVVIQLIEETDGRQRVRKTWTAQGEIENPAL